MGVIKFGANNDLRGAFHCAEWGVVIINPTLSLIEDALCAEYEVEVVLRVDIMAVYPTNFVVGLVYVDLEEKLCSTNVSFETVTLYGEE